MVAYIAECVPCSAHKFIGQTRQICVALTHAVKSDNRKSGNDLDKFCGSALCNTRNAIEDTIREDAY
jgi:hypothetical protein